MQLGGSGSQSVDYWTDARVNAIVTDADAVRVATENATHFLEVQSVGIYFLVLVAGIHLGYMISHYFLPNAKDIGAC